MFGDRGLLSNYAPDVVAVVNGVPITTGDILETKRARQQRQLKHIRCCYDPVVKPAFIFVFKNDGFPYEGWWLYLRTLKHNWKLNRSIFNDDIILKIMQLCPCGLLPMLENFSSWKPAFAWTYSRATEKRPENQGMVVVRAKVQGGKLLDIELQI